MFLLGWLIHDHGFWEIGCPHAVFFPEAQVLLPTARAVHRDLQSAQFLHHVIEPVLHRGFLFRELGIMDEVFLFHGISLDIKEFISVPESVVGDVFILIAA